MKIEEGRIITKDNKKLKQKYINIYLKFLFLSETSFSFQPYLIKTRGNKKELKRRVYITREVVSETFRK